MLPLIFKIDKKQNHYVTPEWVTNGHWAIKREALLVVKKSPLRKSLLALCGLREGRYENFVLVPGNIPDVNRVIPSLESYHKGTVTAAAHYDVGTNSLRYVKLVAENHCEVGLAPEYVPLLGLGDEILIACARLPIVVKKNDAVVCVIMPVKL